MTRLVFLDTETTGLDPRPREVGGKGHEIWEIAYAIVDTEEPTSFNDPIWKHWFFSVDLRNADLIALNIGGFFERYPEYLKDNPTGTNFIANNKEIHMIHWAYNALWEAPKPSSRSAQVGPTNDFNACSRLGLVVHDIMHDLTGAHIIGAVPDFDTRFLTELLYREGGLPTWHYHLIDIESMVAGWLNRDRDFPPPWKSDSLWQAIDIDRSEPQYAKHTARGDAQLVLDCYRKVMGV